MNLTLLNPDVCALLLLGFGAPLFGLIRWANRPVLGIAASVVFAFGAIAVFSLQASVKIWLPCSLLAIGFPAAVAAGRYRDTLLRWSASRRAAAIAMIAVGPLLAGAWAAWIDYSTSALPTEVAAGRENVALPEPVALSITGVTDLGRAVPLARPAEILSAPVLNQAERLLTSGHPNSLIRTDVPDPNYNCHGWVFADAHCWIRNEAVDTILFDNDYRIVESPQPGDVIVYRTADGRVNHTGLVRVVTKDATVVESKWGYVGRFIHPAAEQPYGETWAYYRSNRLGHLIRLGDTPSSHEGIGE